MPSNQFKDNGVKKFQLYADAHHLEEFEIFFKQMGMTQKSAGSRLFAWFNQQSPLIRQHILQPMPDEVAPDIARIVLERMAERDRLRKPKAGDDQNHSENPNQDATGITVYGKADQV